MRIWDSVSGQPMKTIERAHGGMAVSSVRVMGNERYVLSAGLDSIMRMWEVSSGKMVMEYKGHHQQRSEMLQVNKRDTMCTQVARLY